MTSDELQALAVTQAAEIYARIGCTAAMLPGVRVRDVRCGRYYHDTRTITLPLWLREHLTAPRFFEWYVAHELAHGIAGRAAGHGFDFQVVLWALAPEAWAWEGTYKPRQYALACAILG